MTSTPDFQRCYCNLAFGTELRVGRELELLRVYEVFTGIWCIALVEIVSDPNALRREGPQQSRRHLCTQVERRPEDRFV